MTSSEANITRPDQVLKQFDEITVKIFDYQELVYNDINFVRLITGDQYTYLYNKTLSILQNNIKKISVSDSEIRAAIGAETQSACVTSLVTFVDDLVELSGYTISNCIEDKPTVSDTQTFDYSAQLKSLEEETDSKT